MLPQAVNIFHLFRVLVLQKSSEILLYLPRGTRTLPQGCTVVFAHSSLVSASPPFPDQQLFEPVLWNQGRSWRLSLFPINEKQVTQKDFVAQEPHRFLLGFTGSEDIVH